MSETARFFQSLQKTSGTPIESLCAEAHVSTRTYYRMMRCQPVKPECYEKLFIGLCHTVTDEEFMEYWKVLGENLYAKYNEE